VVWVQHCLVFGYTKQIFALVQRAENQDVPGCNESIGVSEKLEFGCVINPRNCPHPLIKGYPSLAWQDFRTRLEENDICH
jgi:hypothetical protein